MRQMSPASTFCDSSTSPAGDVDDVGDAVLGDLEGLVVRAVFLGLLGHQADVGHRCPIVPGSKAPLVLQKLMISW
jgi:hypothetical protein